MQEFELVSSLSHDDSFKFVKVIVFITSVPYLLLISKNSFYLYSLQIAWKLWNNFPEQEISISQLQIESQPDYKPYSNYIQMIMNSLVSKELSKEIRMSASEDQ